ncbi:MAG: ADP-ribosylglycohydrolase family protein [Sandaracinus sp.]|nr:ADP-ribosylglycohydrolase family protein [Sandaracinus sp.]
MSRDRLRGCLLGGALADALAFAHEGRAPGPVPELRVGAISDDTQLTLAACEALIADRGEVRPERVAEHLVLWHRRHGFVGLGASTAKALRELSVGGHWALVGRKGEMAAGNGAAIRIAPLAFVLDLASPRARQVLRDVARITHHSDEAYVGALAIALVIRDALDHEWRGRDALFASLLDALPDTRVRDRLSLVRGSTASIGELAREHGATGYVVDAVPLAIHAYAWAAASGDFSSMVRQLVEAGGDCDSIASMAAQCLGALRGESVLPQELVARLPTIVSDTADRLGESV